jgi:hypothetical protein
MSSSVLRPLTIGEILDGAFTLYRRHFIVLVGTQAVILAPAALLGFFQPVLANALWNFVLAHVAFGAAIWQMSTAALGEKPDLVDGLRVGIRRYFPMLGVTIAYGFLILVGALGAIIGAFFMMVFLFAVHPVTIIENNARTAIQRSFALAKGSKGKIFVVTVVAGIIAFLPQFALGFAAGLISTVGSGPDGEVALLSEEHNPVFFCLQVLVQCLTFPFSVGSVTLLYYDQRVRKEGLDVEMSASALDGLAGEAPASA